MQGKVVSFRQFIAINLLTIVNLAILGESSVLSRIRRSAPEFYGVIQCYQPDALVLALYGDYGCYCGVGGKGRPIDATDRCCEAHDTCYYNARTKAQKTYSETILTKTCGSICIFYSYVCENGSITCASADSELAQRVCECDRVASKCFAEARSTYDLQLANINPSIWCNDNSNITALKIMMTKKYEENENMTSLNQSIATSSAYPEINRESKASRIGPRMGVIDNHTLTTSIPSNDVNVTLAGNIQQTTTSGVRTIQSRHIPLLIFLLNKLRIFSKCTF